MHRWEDFSWIKTFNSIIFSFRRRPIKLVVFIRVGLYTQQLKESVIWTPTVKYQSRATVETPNKTCTRCYNSMEMLTEINTVEWDDCKGKCLQK